MRNQVLLLTGLIALLAVVLLGCSLSRSIPSETTTPPGTTTSTPCPQATPELLRVEPVSSPTDQFSQIVTVHMGNLEVVTITAESGVFTATGSPAPVEVALLPNTVHHLEVVAKVKEIERHGCRYGGYTLRTRRDENGVMLIIEQGQPELRAPGDVIGPDNVSQLEPLFSLAPDARLTADFIFSGNSEIISVGYADKISRWSLITGQESGRIGDGLEEAAALSVAINSDQSLVAAGGTAEDRAVRLWHTATGEMKELGRHESHLTSVAFNPGGTRLASGDNANKVWIWEVASGQSITVLEGDVPKRNQAFHDLYWPDDETLVAAASDAIYWWDVTTGQLLERLARPEEAAFFVDFGFSQNGHRLAAAAQDENVYFWDREAGVWVTWPAQPGTRLSHVEFSPDGHLLAATTFTGDLLLWNVDTQEFLSSYSVTTGDIAAVRFSPDGRAIAVGGWDAVIWLWGIP